MKVCQAMNNANTQLCEDVSKSLNACTENFGKNASEMAAAVKIYGQQSMLALEQQQQQQSKIYDALEKFNENGDCLYPDDIANIMFDNIQDKNTGN